MTIDEQLDFLKKGSVDLIREDDLKKKLERQPRPASPCASSSASTRPSPDIHLGHTVVIRKLKAFQDLGHTVIFLIGDFTAHDRRSVGQQRHASASDRAKRSMPTPKPITMQMFKLLDPDKTELRFNSRMDGQVQRRRFHQALC